MSYLDNIFGNNKLTKLKIESFANKERTGGKATIFAQFNPETLSQKFTTKYAKPQGIGKSGQELKYSNNPPEEMKLKLIFDEYLLSDYHNIAISACNDIGASNVKKQVINFLKYTWIPADISHQPNYLKLIWGGIIFPCRLSSVDIKYTRFDRNGEPTSAELDIVLLGDDEEKRRSLKDNFSSPDLTHLRVVRNGDTLPLLCQDIYGDSRYYPIVAQANNLDDFRNLQPGQNLYFPPLT